MENWENRVPLNGKAKKSRVSKTKWANIVIAFSKKRKKSHQLLSSPRKTGRYGDNEDENIDDDESC